MSDLKSLLSISERLKENLSGQQIADTLDYFIQSAMQYVIESTELVEAALAECVFIYCKAKKRKISALDRAVFQDSFFSFLVSESGKSENLATRVVLYKKLRLERNIPFSILFESFLKETKNYNALYLELYDCEDVERRSQILVQLSDIEEKVFATDSLFFYISNAQACADLAALFKEMIMEKYIRYAFKAAKRASHSTTIPISLEDLFKNCIVNIGKGLDKYDSSAGALTSYFDFWMKDAVTQSTTSHEDGVAFTLTSSQRKRELLKSSGGNVNFTSDLSLMANTLEDNKPDPESEVLEEEHAKVLYRLCHSADPNGFACLTMGIPYLLNAEQRARLTS